MNSRSSFSHHTSCVKCNSRDNRAVYTDGSTYCFGCQDYTPPTHARLSFGKVKEVKKMYNKRRTVPNPNRAWLQQYISDDEIDNWFFFDDYSERHVFAYHEGEPDFFYEGRSVNPLVVPKSLQTGDKPTFIFGRYKETGIVVLVEDLISAIKIARQYGVMPLFGSSCSLSQIHKLVHKDQVHTIPVWLDRDKFPASLDLSQKISLVRNSCVISTNKDPKALTDEEIKEEIEEALALTKKENVCQNY